MRDVILIHGALGAIESLEPLATSLNEARAAGLRWHCLELEGHGSTPSDAPYATTRFASNVRAFMAAKGIARASIFGHSMGGYVALFLAAESPELVASVATLGTKLAWTPDVAKTETSRLHAPTIRAKVPQFADLLEKRHLGAGGWERTVERTSLYLTALGGTPEIGAEQLAEIEQPVRFIVGDRDNLVTVDETCEGARAVPNGEFAVLPNTPHPFEQIRLRLLAAHLMDFFDAAL